MRGPRLGAIALACIVGSGASGGCGGDPSTPSDAGPCWPLDATPGGTVAIGTGDISYEPMPDMLAIAANGSQSDPFIQVHARMTGLPPGDPQDFFAPTNPKTMVSAVIPDLGLTLGIDCPATIGYVVSPDDATAFDLAHSLRIGFGTMLVATVVGHQATISVTVVGSNGLVATDQKTVTLISAAGS